MLTAISLLVVALLFYLQEAVSEKPNLARGGVFLAGIFESFLYLSA